MSEVDYDLVVKARGQVRSAGAGAGSDEGAVTAETKANAKALKAQEDLDILEINRRIDAGEPIEEDVAETRNE